MMPIKIVCPFTILIDTQEKAPWSFSNIRSLSAVDSYRFIYDVPLIFKSLGVGRGDYSILGYEGRVGIERKSMDDLHGTLLGFKDGRRARFQREMEILAGFDRACVMVEASVSRVLAEAPEWGDRSAVENRKTLAGTILHWPVRHGVQWFFWDERRLAEIQAFRFLEWFWLEEQKKSRRARL